MSTKRAICASSLAALLLLCSRPAHAQVMQTGAFFGSNGRITYTAPAGTPASGVPIGPAVYDARTVALFSAMTAFFSSAYPPNPPRWDLFPAVFNGRPVLLAPTPPLNGRR
jgi:hypothetical protein